MSEEMLRSYEELRAEFSTTCAELEKERERREKAESGYCEHRCQSLGIAECMNPEWEDDRAERDRLREALRRCQPYVVDIDNPCEKCIQKCSGSLEHISLCTCYTRYLYHRSAALSAECDRLREAGNNLRSLAAPGMDWTDEIARAALDEWDALKHAGGE